MSTIQHLWARIDLLASDEKDLTTQVRALNNEIVGLKAEIGDMQVMIAALRGENEDLFAEVTAFRWI